MADEQIENPAQEPVVEEKKCESAEKINEKPVDVEQKDAKAEEIDDPDKGKKEVKIEDKKDNDADANVELSNKPKPVNFKKMSQQLSQFVYHVDENDKKARFLGRDSKSWSRILAFYVVYYTLLGFLITYSIRGYGMISIKQPGGIASKITTRLDQPGSSVIPLNQIKEKYDGINLIKFWNKANYSANNLYVETFGKYLDQVNDLNQHENIQDCTNLETIPEKSVCKVQNADKSTINREIIEKSILEEKPIFALSLNKVVGWQPKNSKLDVYLEKQGWSHGFVHNAVYTHCYQTDAGGFAKDPKNGEEEFIVRPYSGSKEFEILPGYFPYHALDKFDEGHPDYENEFLPWNKPFLLMQIFKKNETKNSWEISEDETASKDSMEKTPIYFSCYGDAQNIDRPMRPEDWEKKTCH